MKHRLSITIFAVCLLLTFPAFFSHAQDTDTIGAGAEFSELHLREASMCESIENFKPVHQSAVFAISAASVMCFTDFNVVPQTMDVFHDWIKKDIPVFRKKLVLKPPRWSTVSSIKLRESDKGPWRVEIRDPDGNLLSTLRFSITD
jgi:hypothetical protein